MEGYYWRFTDAARGQVVVALCGVSGSPEGRWGLVALAVHPGGKVWTATVPEATGERYGLGVRAGGTVVAGERELRFDLSPEAALEVAIRDPWRWPRRALGASGLAHVVPGLQQYWHPHVLGGDVRGELRMEGQRVGLDGSTVYAEKNWGPRFPAMWWWGQADAFGEGEACVAFAGGPMRVAGVGMTGTAVVVRVGDRLLALRPPAARVAATVAGGRWRVRARSAGHSVDLEGEASSAVALPVPVPGRREWEPRARHALDGRMSVVVRRGARGGRVLFRGESPLAGLERACG